jgi:hypothetical protein
VEPGGWTFCNGGNVQFGATVVVPVSTLQHDDSRCSDAKNSDAHRFIKLDEFGPANRDRFLSLGFGRYSW